MNRLLDKVRSYAILAPIHYILTQRPLGSRTILRRSPQLRHYPSRIIVLTVSIAVAQKQLSIVSDAFSKQPW